MASSMAASARSTMVRTLFSRAASFSASASAKGRTSFPLRASNFAAITRQRNPIAPPRLPLLRRELSSFEPLHTAIASSYLVSKLPCEATTSSQGRFANYLSPI